MGRLAGKVAIVTGAASGIGAASALRFAEEGARVVASDLTEASLQTTLGKLEAVGADAAAIAADVTDPVQIAALVEQTVERFGKLDVLYCNAGRVLTATLEQTTSEQMRQVFDVNVFGVMECVKAALPHLESSRGNVVVTASKVGIVAQLGTPIYNASKGAVIALVKSLAIDFAKRGIRVNSVCPGIIDTPLFRHYIDGLPDPDEELRVHSLAQPLGRLGTPEECAEAALFLASDDARFITGESILVDGGYTAQ